MTSLSAKVGVRSTYTLPSPDFCGTILGLLLLSWVAHSIAETTVVIVVVDRALCSSAKSSYCEAQPWFEEASDQFKRFHGMHACFSTQCTHTYKIIKDKTFAFV